MHAIVVNHLVKQHQWEISLRQKVSLGDEDLPFCFQALHVDESGICVDLPCDCEAECSVILVNRCELVLIPFDLHSAHVVFVFSYDVLSASFLDDVRSFFSDTAGLVSVFFPTILQCKEKV